jgi:hypothetical protein
LYTLLSYGIFESPNLGMAIKTFTCLMKFRSSPFHASQITK